VRRRPQFHCDSGGKVGPAVVRINATRKVANQIPEAFNNPCFAASSGMSDRRSEERVERGTGSGFILSMGHLLCSCGSRGRYSSSDPQGWSEF